VADRVDGRAVIACAVCTRPILRALLPDGERVVLDAAKVPDGQYAAWHSRRGLNWIWHAREATPETWSGDVAYRLHDCPGSAGQQMQLGAA
jgi:hypothetical protein